MAERNQTMVDFRTDTLVPDIRVKGISEVQGSSPLGQRLDVAFRGKDEYLGGKEIQLDRIKKVQSVRVRAFQYLGNGPQPFVELRIFFYIMLLILPMGGKAFLGNLVHTAAADLYFHPLPVRSHHGQVQRLITVGFRTAHPITDTVGTNPVNIRNSRVDIPTLVFLVHTGKRVKNNADRINIINILESDTLAFHLIPNGIDRFHTGTHLILKSHRFQLLVHRGGETFE